MKDVRITISMSGEELKELEDRMFSGRHRSLSSYIRGVLFPGQGKSVGLGTIPSPKKEEIKTSTEVEKLVKRGLVKKGVKELPSQDTGGFKTYFK